PPRKSTIRTTLARPSTGRAAASVVVVGSLLGGGADRPSGLYSGVAMPTWSGVPAAGYWANVLRHFFRAVSLARLALTAALGNGHVLGRQRRATYTYLRLASLAPLESRLAPNVTRTP